MLRVIDHYPAINDIDVPRNAQINVTFNQGIIPQSVDYTRFSVNDASTFTSVPGTLSVGYNVSGIPNALLFTPINNMAPNNNYTAYVYGTPNSVLGNDNSQLDPSYSWNFKTGSTLINPSQSGVLPSGSYVTDSGVFESGIFYPNIPSVAQVMSTYPLNQQPNMNLFTNNIEIFLNFIPSGVTNIADYITVDTSNVLGD